MNSPSAFYHGRFRGREKSCRVVVFGRGEGRGRARPHLGLGWPERGESAALGMALRHENQMQHPRKDARLPSNHLLQRQGGEGKVFWGGAAGRWSQVLLLEGEAAKDGAVKGSRARQSDRAWGGTARGFLGAAANTKRSRDLCPQPPAVPQAWLSFKHEGSYSV